MPTPSIVKASGLDETKASIESNCLPGLNGPSDLIALANNLAWSYSF